MKIFGSDGFRCEFGTKFLTNEFITKFASSLSAYYIACGFSKPIVIARDTRQSGVIIENLVLNVLIKNGINVVTTGVLPTPGLSKILEEGDYAFGCMITASHNPHQDNGIKLLRADGFKIDLEVQDQIEHSLKNDSSVELDHPQIFGTHLSLEAGFQQYITSLKSCTKPVPPRSGVIIDCSNGANSFSHNCFKDMANLKFCANEPNGNNINLNCGSLEPEILLNTLKKTNADYGVAFDGDGDRAIFISKEYGAIETEKLAVLFFEMLKAETDPNDYKVVTTEISNLSFKHNIAERGGKLIETPVGDRFVINAVNEENALFGFEPSGHFYFPRTSRSMDGMATFLKFLNILNLSANLNEDLMKLSFYKRVNKNFDISKNMDIDEHLISERIQDLIYNDNEKIIIRKSMWDPVLRVYYDYKGKNNFSVFEDRLLKLIDNSEIQEI